MRALTIPARFDDYARGYISQLDSAVTAAVGAWEKGGLGPEKFREMAAAARAVGNEFRAGHYEATAVLWERDPRIPVAYDLLGATAAHGTTHHFLSEYVKLVEGAAA